MTCIWYCIRSSTKQPTRFLAVVQLSSDALAAQWIWGFSRSISLGNTSCDTKCVDSFEQPPWTKEYKGQINSLKGRMVHNALWGWLSSKDSFAHIDFSFGVTDTHLASNVTTLGDLNPTSIPSTYNPDPSKLPCGQTISFSKVHYCRP